MGSRSLEATHTYTPTSARAHAEATHSLVNVRCPWACLSLVVQAYKALTGDWQWDGCGMVVERYTRKSHSPRLNRTSLTPVPSLKSPLLMTSSTSNFCCKRNSSWRAKARKMLCYHDRLYPFRHAVVADQLAQV